MSALRWKVRFPYKSLLPGDESVQTFYFQSSGDDEEVFEGIGLAIDNFYRTTDAGASILGQYSSVLDLRFVHVEVGLLTVADGTVEDLQTFEFDWSDPDGFTTNGRLPNELAVCLSYRSDGQLGTTSTGRERGRLFLGPWCADMLDEGGIGTPAHIVSDRVNMIATRAVDLKAEIIANDLGAWCLYSRADGALKEITGGWIDNEFDTQRRREQLLGVPRVLWSEPG